MFETFCARHAQKGACLGACMLLVASQYALLGYGDRRVEVRGPGWTDHCK